MYFVYKIFYKDKVVYVGRTNNIENRIRQHITPGKIVDAEKISKIEFAEVSTEADMNLYELYYILKYKPELNSKDTTKDELSIELEELKFKPFYSYLYDTWKSGYISKKRKNLEKTNRKNEIKQLLSTETSTMAQEILRQQYYCLVE